MRNIIIAIDSFKGCLTSKQANQAAAEAVLTSPLSGEGRVGALTIPVSDGGEGWLEAFQAAIDPATVVDVHVKDPLLRPITAQYLKKDDTAVIEMAKANGLTLLSPEERSSAQNKTPMVATTYGTGQLIIDAVRRGCKHIIVGLGGSATTDCGIGMLRAIIDGFNCDRWDEVKALDDIRFTIATDVTNPLCGINGAAHVFGPQKGATPEMVLALDARAKRFAEASSRHFGYDRQHDPGAGAAGGLGYAFLQYFNAECRPGIDLLLDAIHFDQLLEEAALIITGEGSADRQTLMGKLPYGILQRATQHHVPVALIAGRTSDIPQLLDAGFSHVECINPPGLSLEEAMTPKTAMNNIRDTVRRLISK